MLPTAVYIAISSTYLGLFCGPRVPLVLFPFFDSMAAARHFHLISFHLIAIPSSRYLCGHMLASSASSSSSSTLIFRFRSKSQSPALRHRRLTLNNNEQSQSWCAILKLSVTFVSDDARQRANKIWYTTDSSRQKSSLYYMALEVHQEWKALESEQSMVFMNH